MILGLLEKHSVSNFDKNTFAVNTRLFSPSVHRTEGRGWRRCRIRRGGDQLLTIHLFRTWIKVPDEKGLTVISLTSHFLRFVSAQASYIKSSIFVYLVKF